MAKKSAKGPTLAAKKRRAWKSVLQLEQQLEHLMQLEHLNKRLLLQIRRHKKNLEDMRVSGGPQPWPPLRRRR